MCNFCSNFASVMRKVIFFVCAFAMMACNKPSRVEQYKADKHKSDSIHLVEQTTSLAYYQAQLEQLMPVADSLLPFFAYEKNEKYQDHGYYVVKGGSLRILVRDDGRDLLVYKEGKRQAYPDNSLKGMDREMVERAEHLQVTIRDIKECEKRIARTSLEKQKYEKRLQNQLKIEN